MPRKTYLYAGIAASVLLTAALANARSDSQAIRIRDDCDPVTFNAAPPTGPGLGEICDPSFDGDTTFAEFLEELGEDREVGGWRFNPDDLELDRRERTVLENRSGEFHTFTRVANFGGGLVPELNELGGFGPTVPECQINPGIPTPTNFPVDGIALKDRQEIKGPTAGSAALPRGSTTNWQCCIHPWMKSTIKVK
jgi:hypothetical protein